MRADAYILRSSIVLSMLIICCAGFSQKPVIRAVDKTSAHSGEVVTFQGTFNNDITKIAVSFGGSSGRVKFVSDQLLEVQVPPGSTYEDIIVTDLVTGLSDQSDFPFLYSFGGNNGITTSSLEGQVDFNSESGLYDLCMCDFDNDGKTDVATANEGSASISIFANTTASTGLSNISFSAIPFSPGFRSIHTRCGDLNGDGKPDLVLTEGGGNGNRVMVLQNTSMGSGALTFSSQTITIANKKVKRIDIADLDNDGKPEIIISNQTGGNVIVLTNASTPASISFAAPLSINIPGAASTDGLAVADLDSDGLPEIVTAQYLTQTSNIFILGNNSLPGNISFGYNQMLELGGTVVNLKCGDLDGDGKAEIAATQLVGGTVSVFRNQTSGAMTFASPVTFPTDVRPWGLDFGDVDGDGLTDIVVASLEKSISILNNKSTSGTLAFSTLIQPTTFINRHAGVGDVDDDGKPDIIFTSVDDSNNNIIASRISVFRNRNCLVPSIDPAGPIAMCTGFPLQLRVAASAGTNYEWNNGTTTVANGPDAFFDVTTAGSYSVTATAERGACSETSNTVSVTVDPGITTGTATPVNDGPVCPGGAMSLSVNDVGGTSYNWTGPNGYIGTGLTPDQVTNFQPMNAGRYYVDVVVNGCVAQRTSTVVEMISLPDFQITYSGPDVICPPDTKTLTLVPNDPNFTYQWAEKTAGDIAGATGPTVTVNNSGEYFIKAQYTPKPSCAAIEVESVSITFSTTPVADFSAPLNACTNQVINFANQSTGDAAVTRYYLWSFGDSQTSALENPTYQYSTAGTYTVTLDVSYQNGACENVLTKDIFIQDAPIAAITTPGGTFAICPGDSLELGLSASYNAYQWSTGETTPAIYVTNGGSYSVDVVSGSCIITTTVEIALLDPPVVTALAKPAQINEGGSSQLSATGLSNYFWDPADVLNDALIATPLATPSQSTLFTVQGTATNGCTGSATVEVKVKGDFIVNKLGPSKLISPDNGDAINNFWMVENILNYPQCSVTIYDDKGIKVHEAKPYNNEWDGTYRGRQLPDGVYYYIIRCDGEENNPRSGGITILR